jgi:hypothetical protein
MDKDASLDPPDSRLASRAPTPGPRRLAGALARRLSPLLLLMASAASALQVGDSYESVLKEKGPPASQMQAGARRLLNYPEVTVRLENDVVVSVGAAAKPGVPGPTPIPAPARPLTAAEQIAAVKRALQAATERVKEIVNQPPPSVPITPAMKVAWYGDAWFHPGAATPDFDNVDVRKTQDLSNYSRYEYVSSNMTRTVAYPGGELEFNSMTKFFYTDRSVPKKKLSEAEMLEINRLYRVIGRCQADLGRLGAQ